MREMKDSGIPWIGKIPKNWNLMKIKYTLKERIEKNSPVKTTNILSLTAKQGVIPYGEKEGGGNKPKEDVSEYHLAYPGDIVMNSMNVLSGSVGLSKYFGCVSPVYYMLRPQSQNEDVRFYNYIFQTEVFQKSLFGLGNGILIKESSNGKFNTIRMRIPMEKFRKLYLPVASIEEQQRIANYLDAKCAKIDSIKKNVEAEIEALKQYKKSVITEAVTKGLNKNVEMKDSGIPWIGKIPKDWMIGKIKQIADYSLNYPIGDGDHGLIKSNDYQPEGIPYIRVLNLTWGFGLDLKDIVYISEQQNRMIKGSQLKPGDILIAKTGATIGKTAIIPKTLPISNTTSHVGKISVSKEYCEMFFYYQMNSSIVQKQINDISSMQSTRPELGINGLKNLIIIIPPISEQYQITNYLDKKCTKINFIIQKKQEVLQDLDTYKKSLIYEYVTGKKEVPAV